MDRVRFLVGVPKDAHAKLEREAERAGVTLSLYVDALIESHLSLLEALRGNGDDEPGDLVE